jgi:DNA replication protein DnaC
MTKDTRHDHKLRERALRLGLHGLLANWDDVKEAAWLPAVITYEESERTWRSLERRIKDARLGRFKALADYDWEWPKKIDKTAIDDLFKLSFFEDGANSVLLGPNGVGKTLLLKNPRPSLRDARLHGAFHHGQRDAQRAGCRTAAPA